MLNRSRRRQYWAVDLYEIALHGYSGGVLSGVSVQDNYLDTSGAFGAFYITNASGVTASNNVDMTTSDIVQSNNSEVALTTVTKVIASPSSGH